MHIEMAAQLDCDVQLVAVDWAPMRRPSRQQTRPLLCLPRLRRPSFRDKRTATRSASSWVE